MTELRVISLGAGVQSSGMYRMAAMGMFEHMPSAAIFADTQDEPSWVYETLDSLERDHGDVIPIHRVTVGSLSESWFEGQDNGKPREEWAMGASVPLHIKNPDGSKGFVNRDCTQRFKLTPLLREQKRLLEQRRAIKDGGHCEVWMGISLDEVQRMTTSKYKWQTNRYPLIFDRPMRRGEIIEWHKANGFPVPKRSACVYCPLHSDREWLVLKEHPEEWAKAVEYDRRMRAEPRFVSTRGNPENAWRKGTPYVHASLVPLDEVELKEDDPNQIDLFNQECSGICGV